MEQEILDSYIKAGRIAAEALAYGTSLIVPGARIVDVLDKIEAFINERGGKPAFPAQVSLNDVAAHFCPTEDDERTFLKTDLVKLDVGVHVDGYVGGDNAVTINLDPEDEEKERLVAASRAARDAAIALVKPGVTPHELGEVIAREITGRGFRPIRNLSGHGLSRWVVHTSPSIPNYPNGDHRPLEAGMIIAIEPFATTGKGEIYSSNDPTLFALVAARPVRSQTAREALARIKTWNGLPFTTRWLSHGLGVAKTKLALLELKRNGMLHEYPPLPDMDHGLVSQSEHTMLVTEDGCRILTQP